MSKVVSKNSRWSELQRLVVPNLEFGANDDLYVRFSNDRILALRGQGKIRFLEQGTAYFDTFFNGFSVGRWKKFCALPDLRLHLEGKGRFVVRLCLHRLHHSHRVLVEQEIVLSEGKADAIELSQWEELEDGILYYTITALVPGEITGCQFVTTALPKAQVKLGIVITHFNRKKYVLPAIKRLRDGLLLDPLYKNNIALVVVDNSKNLTREEVRGATLIPNRNLGGSGGFMRGLLYLEDTGAFTHCLFMDDDASCETESIRRTYAILSHARLENVAVAGSVLRELEKYRLTEKGALFDGWCRPQKSGMDMRHPLDLLKAEVEDVRPDYGGWWFLAFKLSDVKHYSFPFFVRGDDILFGLMHKFNLCTMNGVSTWGDDFTLKNSPTNCYLDMRYHLLIQSARLKSSRWAACKKFYNAILGHVFSYNYTYADAMILAAKHVQIGAKFWKENSDFLEIRKELSSLPAMPKLVELSSQTIRPIHHSRNEHKKFARFLQQLTIGGLLVPSVFFYKQTLFQPKGFQGHSEHIFRYKSVFYGYEATGQGYLVEFQRLRFLKTYLRAMKCTLGILINYKAISKKQTEAIDELTRRDYWASLYANIKAPQADART